MFKSEPKTILNFLANRYDLLKQFFDIQIENQVISHYQFLDILKESNNIVPQLFEHKIIIEQHNDYKINEPYFHLFQFILEQFKPLLPEEIEKFCESIIKLFKKIKEGNLKEKNILLDRIEALSNEISKFINHLKNNTKALLKESQELKANIQKIEYPEKIQRARYLIEHYISPLNKILDNKHSQSIYNEILKISDFVNIRAFDNTDEGIRIKFEQLYHLLDQSLKDIDKQSRIVVDELLPLIERVKKESEYLQGFYLYLKNGDCYKKIEPPPLFDKKRFNLYKPCIYENTKEYFEQFQGEKEVVFEEESNLEKPWFFDKNKYKHQLDHDLPVDDFFNWCQSTLKKEKENFNLDDFLIVTSLFFEEDYDIILHSLQKVCIKTEQGQLLTPKLKIIKKEKLRDVS